MKAFISVVVPAFNEESNVSILAEKVVALLEKEYHYEIIFIDDGSKDKTLETLKSLHEHNKNIHYLSFSRNFGHQSALKAGLDKAEGDCVISMDADLQHPPHLIPVMLEKWQQGYDIVYTQRADSAELSFFKRKTSHWFYTFMNKVSDIELENGTADFRLLDRKVVEVVKNSQEYNLFLRGFIAWIGFKQYKLPYQPEPRFSGQSKYTFKKMLSLALNGITSFSVKPLQIATFLGSFISLFAFLYGIYALIIFFFTDSAVPGWTSVLVSVLFIGGLQLLVLGIIGEYLGKILLQSKQRADYFLRESSK
ncbi:MAG: glycosyltransferase family 2 protein [Bacteroidia bacterium]